MKKMKQTAAILLVLILAVFSLSACSSSNKAATRDSYRTESSGSAVYAPDEPAEDGQEDERLTDILEFVAARLSEQEQRIFCLRFTEGFSYEEIAVREGISRVAVWKHLSHAVTAIKKQFNPRML